MLARVRIIESWFHQRSRVRQITKRRIANLQRCPGLRLGDQAQRVVRGDPAKMQGLEDITHSARRHVHGEGTGVVGLAGDGGHAGRAFPAEKSAPAGATNRLPVIGDVREDAQARQLGPEDIDASLGGVFDHLTLIRKMNILVAGGTAAQQQGA